MCTNVAAEYRSCVAAGYRSCVAAEYRSYVAAEYRTYVASEYRSYVAAKYRSYVAAESTITTALQAAIRRLSPASHEKTWFYVRLIAKKRKLMITADNAYICVRNRNVDFSLVFVLFMHSQDIRRSGDLRQVIRTKKAVLRLTCCIKMIVDENRKC